MKSELPLTFICPKEAARLLGCSPKTLATHRREGIGLPFWQPRAADGTPIGRPRYALEDVLAARDAARQQTISTLPRPKCPKHPLLQSTTEEDSGT